MEIFLIVVFASIIVIGAITPEGKGPGSHGY